MFDVKIRNVVRRGRAHSQRCEDDSLVFSSNHIAVIAVFDGCSDGTDSYFASGLFAKIFKKIAIETESDKYFEKINQDKDLEEIAHSLLDTFFAHLKFSVDYLKLDLSEILSTIVLSVVNLATKQSYSVIIGDGSVYADGDVHSAKPNNENAPDYISYYLTSPFDDVWKNNVYKYRLEIKDTIAVMSDGIDSFKNYSENRHVNETEKNDILYRFFKSGFLLGNKIGLARICNILEGSHIAPSDDLSIAQITFVEIPKQNETVYQ